MSSQLFTLPDVGEGLTEADIVSWHVAVGDTVSVNQVLVDIETAKSIVELPSPHDGVVVRLLAEPGETVPVGQAIIEIDAAGSSPAEQQGQVAEEPKLLVGYGATEFEATSRRRRRQATAASAPASPAAPASTSASVSTSAPHPTSNAAAETPRPRAKPPVRRLARELGVDLHQVAPSGPHGTITRDDVAQAGSPAGHDESAAATSQEPTRIPITGVRKQTAEAMVRSAFTAPHVTEFITVDVTRSVELRKMLQSRPEFAQIKLTPLAFVARAYLTALVRTPMAGAKWDEQAQEIVVPHHINLGIAAATPRGLIVPNIKHADKLKFIDLAAALAELTATAKAGKVAPADLAGGTTTITNIGGFGIDSGTPILNPGETAILAVGAINRRPWVVTDDQGERIEPRSVMQLALSFDHRVIDGAEGSQLLADTAELLTEPALALL